jgi:glycosyltransferase involved in cell wall biosynthesis
VTSAPDTLPAVSVIVPTTGTAPFLDEQLASLAAQVGAPSFEVVVVLNHSNRPPDALRQTWGARLDLRPVVADERAEH